MREEVHAQSSGFALDFLTGNAVSRNRLRCLGYDIDGEEPDLLSAPLAPAAFFAAMQQVPII